MIPKGGGSSVGVSEKNFGFAPNPFFKNGFVLKFDFFN